MVQEKEDPGSEGGGICLLTLTQEIILNFNFL